MKKKDVKKLIIPVASIIALSIGSFKGLSDSEINNLNSSIVAFGSSILAILGMIGVFSNTDKKDDNE